MSIEWSKVISPSSNPTTSNPQNQSKFNEDVSIIYALSSINSIGLITGFNSSNGSVVGNRYCSFTTSNAFMILKPINSVVYVSLSMNYMIATLIQFSTDLNINSIFQFSNITPLTLQSKMQFYYKLHGLLWFGSFNFNKVNFINPKYIKS